MKFKWPWMCKSTHEKVVQLLAAEMGEKLEKMHDEIVKITGTISFLQNNNYKLKNLLHNFHNGLRNGPPKKYDKQWKNLIKNAREILDDKNKDVYK